MNSKLKNEFFRLANPEKARLLSGFFKTGPGEYSEGDVFLGIVVPSLRKLASEFKDLSLDAVQELLSSKIHEHRLMGLFILEIQYNKNKEAEAGKVIVDLYLKNVSLGRINNWDLIDLSAPKILGDYLVENKEERKILYDFTHSKNLWKKRIAVLTTFAFIKNNDFEDSLRIAAILLNDKHDLIHKAVGWMLREIGKKNISVEYAFLDKHYKKMPRTMLRYAIERFSDKKRKFYMRK